MVQEDVQQVGALLRTYMAKFDIEQKFETDEEIEHWFLRSQGKGAIKPGEQGREDQVVWAYVVEVGGSMMSCASVKFAMKRKADDGPARICEIGPLDTPHYGLCFLLLPRLAHHGSQETRHNPHRLHLLLCYRYSFLGG